MPHVKFGNAPRNLLPAKALGLRGAGVFAPMMLVLWSFCYSLQDSDSPGKPPLFVSVPPWKALHRGIRPASHQPASILFQISKAILTALVSCVQRMSQEGKAFPLTSTSKLFSAHPHQRGHPATPRQDGGVSSTPSPACPLVWDFPW